MSDNLKRALKRTNFDELNEKGYVRVKGTPENIKEDAVKVSASTPAAKKLESHSNPYEIETQNLKRAFRQGTDVVGKFRGGKLGALAAIGTLGYQALKGEPVMAQDIVKSGAELLNPLPFSMDEIKSETDKMDLKKKLDQLIADKELERKMREERARPGALEFGKYLKKIQK